MTAKKKVTKPTKRPPKPKPKPKQANGKPTYIATPAQWVDVRSETRPEVTHHVWTGEPVIAIEPASFLDQVAFWLTPPHCTCENFRWEDRHPGVLLTCKHIRMVIYEEGGS